MNLARYAAEADHTALRIDGRIKTLLLLGAVLVSSTLAHWQIALVLWLGSVSLFLLLRLRCMDLLKRLVMPLGIAWLVFLSVLFTHGSHPLFALHTPFLTLTAWQEGALQGLLLFVRIMAAVSFATLLAFSTPMIEILETLRICKIPATIIDLADLMYRYVFILEETAHTMRSAQLSRLGNTGSWAHRIADTGRIASGVLIQSLDRATRIYQAMLARGYSEESTTMRFFTHAIPARDRCIGTLGAVALLLIEALNLCWR